MQLQAGVSRGKDGHAVVVRRRACSVGRVVVVKESICTYDEVDLKAGR